MKDSIEKRVRAELDLQLWLLQDCCARSRDALEDGRPIEHQIAYLKRQMLVIGKGAIEAMKELLELQEKPCPCSKEKSCDS